MDIFRHKFEVRDYECDLQGIVNNANYQHYLEHARHVFIKSIGIDFAQLHNEGVDLVVAKLEMAFKTPLKSGEDFEVTVQMKKDGIRWVFNQDIYRIPDQKLVVRARVDAVAVVNGRLSDYKPLEEAFGLSSTPND